LVRLVNQIWFSFVVVLLRRLPFDHVTTCYLLSVESGCCSNRERSKNCDEELLRTGVSVSEKNQRVLKEGVSALWMNEVLNDGVSAKRRNNCWTELFRR
jgi:hypothetical protein